VSRKAETGLGSPNPYEKKNTWSCPNKHAQFTQKKVLGGGFEPEKAGQERGENVG